MSENYDIQQVCENGHQITGCYQIRESERQQFCQKCGALTIIACRTCGKEIQGDEIENDVLMDEWSRGWHSIDSSVVPSYCRNCGKPYPWTESKIAAALQMLEEFGDLNDEEKRTIEQDINNIAKDIPQTKLSAMRIKRILGKCGKVAYDVVMEFASKTAAEILKGP